MSRQARSIHSESMTASGAIAVHRFVKGTGAQCGAAEGAIGVSEAAAADTEILPVTVIGTAVVETAGLFAKGDALESDASGKAVIKAAGVKNAIALQACTVIGQFVEVLVTPN